MKFEQVSLSDLDQIVAIEQAGFNAQEAGDEASYRQRIETIPDSFLVAKEAEKVVGFVVGPVTKRRFVEDWMYEDTPENLPEGGHQLIFTIAIAPDQRGKGIGSQLLEQFEKNARKKNRTSIALTCLEDRIPFYEKNGFTNQGISDSEHGNETWYNMEKVLS